MAVRTDGLRTAWRALGGREGEGWQTIPVSIGAPCTLFAGRRLPGGEEAVLIGFHNMRSLPDSHLPQGHGFEVVRLHADPTGANRLVVALARKVGGSLELFTMMAEDLVNLLDDCAAADEGEALRRFLGRIRAWQDFMDRHREGVLSAESEQGLFGELVLLDCMLEAGVPARQLIEAWQGPMDGLHDFMFGTGGVEVKTSLSTSGFRATVTSLDQLDDSQRQPIFVAAIRLAIHSSGRTLPEMADAIMAKLRGSPVSLEMFEVNLMRAGLLPGTAGHYTRRFLHASTVVLAVQESFPRLTRANVPPAIRNVRYEIDLDLAGAEDVGLQRALALLGVV
jgi:hypothetical protein